jgi:hypothetical protein
MSGDKRAMIAPPEDKTGEDAKRCADFPETYSKEICSEIFKQHRKIGRAHV